MARSRPIIEADQLAASTSDVLRAVSRALGGDRDAARVLVMKTRSGIEDRLRKELAALWRSDPSTTEKPKIRGARLSPPHSFPRPAPPEVVELRFADGRMAQVTQRPRTARHRDLVGVMRVNDNNFERAFAAIAHNGHAIDKLAASQQELADRVLALQSSGDMALLRGLVEGLAGLERRLERVRRVQQQGLRNQGRSSRARFDRLMRELAVETRDARIQKLHGAVSSIQSVALATNGQLLDKENLQLAANQLGWSFAPQILEALGLSTRGQPSPLAWLAPLANLVTSKAIVRTGKKKHD